MPTDSDTRPETRAAHSDDEPGAGGGVQGSPKPTKPTVCRIAFSKWLAGQGVQIFTMLTDGSGIEQLTGGEGQGHNWGPAWSPDGRRICFTSTRNRYARLYLMDADGSGQEQLTAIQEADDDAPTGLPMAPGSFSVAAIALLTTCMCWSCGLEPKSS